MASRLITLLAVFTVFIVQATSLPLSVKNRWIVDAANGKRVKLACVNLVAHLQPMLVEGLDKQPMSKIAADIANNGFNCVRLTYATYMFTRYGNNTVSKTMLNLDIPDVVANVAKHNAFVLNMTHLEAYDAIVDELGSNGVMVVFDNQMSEPGWCCPSDNENGFFGQRHFQVDEWQKGLEIVAQRYKGKSNAVGMGLRNELRGLTQNSYDWYKYYRPAATAIHKINPDMLVVISGLNFDNDFSYLKDEPLGLSFTDKLVYEFHEYSFTSPSPHVWTNNPLNKYCASFINGIDGRIGFLVKGDNPAPLFLTEFGMEFSGTNEYDNRYMACIGAYIVSLDLDWALWTFQGSYYYREGNIGPEESYGVINGDWNGLRYPKFHERFQLLFKMVNDPSSKLAKSHIMYYTDSGQCVLVNNDELEVGNCTGDSIGKFTHDGNGAPITLMDSSKCLKAVGEGRPAMLSNDCLSAQSAWKTVSDSHLHLATADGNGDYLCLQKDSSSNKIVTKKCICIGSETSCLDDPRSQWFKLITTNSM